LLLETAVIPTRALFLRLVLAADPTEVQSRGLRPTELSDLAARPRLVLCQRLVLVVHPTEDQSRGLRPTELSHLAARRPRLVLCQRWDLVACQGEVLSRHMLPPVVWNLKVVVLPRRDQILHLVLAVGLAEDHHLLRRLASAHQLAAHPVQVLYQMLQAWLLTSWLPRGQPPPWVPLVLEVGQVAAVRPLRVEVDLMAKAAQLARARVARQSAMEATSGAGMLALERERKPPSLPQAAEPNRRQPSRLQAGEQQKQPLVPLLQAEARALWLIVVLLRQARLGPVASALPLVPLRAPTLEATELGPWSNQQPTVRRAQQLALLEAQRLPSALLLAMG